MTLLDAQLQKVMGGDPLWGGSGSGGLLGDMGPSNTPGGFGAVPNAPTSMSPPQSNMQMPPMGGLAPTPPQQPSMSVASAFQPEEMPGWKKALSVIGGGLAGSQGPVALNNYLGVLKGVKGDRKKDSVKDMMQMYSLLKNDDIQGAQNYLATRMERLVGEGANADDSGQLAEDMMADPAMTMEKLQDTILMSASGADVDIPPGFFPTPTTLEKNLATLGISTDSEDARRLAGLSPDKVTTLQAKLNLIDPSLTIGSPAWQKEVNKIIGTEVKRKPGGSAELPGVHSAKILDDGTVISLTEDNEVQVRNNQGEIVAGNAAQKAIHAAQVQSAKWQGERAGARGAAGVQMDRAETAIEGIVSTDSALHYIDELVDAIDAGGVTGPIAKYMPSFERASILLDNSAANLGLMHIKQQVFGQLNKSELDLGLDSAVPLSLEPVYLKKWAKGRRKYLQIYRDELYKGAVYLSNPQNNLEGYLKMTYEKKEPKPKKKITVQQMRDQLRNKET